MNMLLDNHLVKAMPCGQNLSYILENSTMFLPTEYKVLQSQGTQCFVRCMKMNFNGKIQLYYITKDYKSLTTLLPSMDVDSFMVICANLLADIIDVKNNGFLSCQNIDISFEHVYVDPTTYKVYLLYLPINESIYEEDAVFENTVRSELLKLISEFCENTSPKIRQFANDLSDGTLSMEALLSKIKTNSGQMIHEKRIINRSVKSETMKLVALNAPQRVEIEVTKDHFVLGKHPDLADEVISFNKMISRKHCEICKNGSEYIIMDLGSANGTYVNRMRIDVNVPVAITNGDIIRLANSDFQVILG